MDDTALVLHTEQKAAHEHMIWGAGGGRREWARHADGDGQGH